MFALGVLSTKQTIFISTHRLMVTSIGKLWRYNEDTIWQVEKSETQIACEAFNIDRYQWRASGMGIRLG